MAENETSDVTSGLCILPQTITEDQWAFYHAFLWWVEGFGAILMGSMGISLNVITIFVLLGTELAASFFNWLLVSLAVFDIFFLLNGILEALRNHIGSTNTHTYVFIVFLYQFRSVVMCCSIYTTVVLALERYNAIARPIAHQTVGFRTGRQSLRQYFSMHWVRLLKYIGPIILFSTIFYIPKRFELEIGYRNVCSRNETFTNNCSLMYDVKVADLRNNAHYNLWYINIANFLVTVVIPVVSLTYLNMNIFLKFKEYLQRQPRTNIQLSNQTEADAKTRKREKDMIQQTMILFSIVILFCLFHILRIVLNVEEFSSLSKREMANEHGCEWLQYWTIIASPVSHILLLSNSSMNFIIYCYFNKAFREHLMKLIAPFASHLKRKCDTADATGVSNGSLRNVSNLKENTSPHTRVKFISAIEEVELDTIEET